MVTLPPHNVEIILPNVARMVENKIQEIYKDQVFVGSDGESGSRIPKELNENHLTFIHPNTFEGLQNLQELDLSGVLIEKSFFDYFGIF